MAFVPFSLYTIGMRIRVRYGILLCVFLKMALASCANAEEFSLESAAGRAVMNPCTLELRFQPTGGHLVKLSAAMPEALKVENLKHDATQAAWGLPEQGIQVSVQLLSNALSVHFLSSKSGRFTWPRISEPSIQAWALPLDEGALVPADDSRWISHLGERGGMDTTADLGMAFLGLQFTNFSISVVLPNPFNNELRFTNVAGRLSANLTHEFTRIQKEKEYSVRFRMGTNSPIEAARHFREWLMGNGEFVSLKEKIRRTPEVTKLPGAAHIYLWGTEGVSPKMIHRLAAAGFDRLWLGSDSWAGFVNRPETVEAARKAGYLIGPYDSYNSIHRPGEAGTWETSQFDEDIYESGAIVAATGKKKAGFKQRGHLLSPLVAQPSVEKRVTKLMGLFSANSWFIDCDGFGQFYDDYSETHPASQADDVQARRKRMAWIRDQFHVVIGSEGCSAPVAPTIHFAHGVMTPSLGWGDADMADKKSPWYQGSWYPPNEPAVFFRPIPLKDDYHYFHFDPRFRLPLFEAVFHDSVVATHHWGSGSFKYRDETQTTQLLEVLYGVPPLWHLDIAELDRRGKEMKRYYGFFSPLLRQTATLPLTSFEWLTPDRLVQKTTFGDRIEVIANLRPTEFRQPDRSVAAHSVMVHWRDSGQIKRFVP